MSQRIDDLVSELKVRGTPANDEYFPGLSGPCYVFHPHRSRITIQEAARTLSRICRFGGRTERFYSVAEHSVWVSEVCAPVDAMAGLLHDLSEAWLGDVISPIKRHIPEYKVAVSLWDNQIKALWGLEHRADAWPESVQYADLLALAKESWELLPGRAEQPWGPHKAPEGLPTLSHFGLNALGAERAFLARYVELGGKL